MTLTHEEVKDEHGKLLGLRRSDGAMVPADPANSDYQRYLRWLEDPNADEFQPPLS